MQLFLQALNKTTVDLKEAILNTSFVLIALLQILLYCWPSNELMVQVLKALKKIYLYYIVQVLHNLFIFFFIFHFFLLSRFILHLYFQVFKIFGGKSNVKKSI